MRSNEVCCTNFIVMVLAVVCFQPVVDVADGCQVVAAHDTETASSLWGGAIMFMQVGLEFPIESQVNRNRTGAEVQGTDMFEVSARKQVVAERAITNKMIKELTARKSMVAGSNTQTPTADTSIVMSEIGAKRSKSSSGVQLPAMAPVVTTLSTVGEPVHDGVAQFEARLSNWSHVFGQSLSRSFSKFAFASSLEQDSTDTSVMKACGTICGIIVFFVGLGVCLVWSGRGNSNRFDGAPQSRPRSSASDHSTSDRQPTHESLEHIRSKWVPPPQTRSQLAPKPTDVTHDVPFEIRSPMTPQRDPRDDTSSQSAAHSDG